MYVIQYSGHLTGISLCAVHLEIRIGSSVYGLVEHCLIPVMLQPAHLSCVQRKGEMLMRSRRESIARDDFYVQLTVAAKRLFKVS